MLLLCSHFLTRQHIPHTTNFDKLVDLVVCCGGEDLKQFADRAGRNATYTSTDAVFDFIEAINTWVDEFQLKLFHKAPNADECTDITTIEELSVFRPWVEDGEPVELFFLPLKNADAQSEIRTLTGEDPAERLEMVLGQPITRESSREQSPERMLQEGKPPESCSNYILRQAACNSNRASGNYTFT